MNPSTVLGESGTEITSQGEIKREYVAAGVEIKVEDLTSYNPLKKPISITFYHQGKRSSYKRSIPNGEIFIERNREIRLMVDGEEKRLQDVLPDISSWALSDSPISSTVEEQKTIVDNIITFPQNILAANNVGYDKGIELLAKGITHDVYSYPTENIDPRTGDKIRKLRVSFQNATKTAYYSRSILGADCQIDKRGKIHVTLDGEDISLQELFPDMPSWIFKKNPHQIEVRDARSNMVYVGRKQIA